MIARNGALAGQFTGPVANSGEMSAGGDFALTTADAFSNSGNSFPPAF